MGCDVLDHGKDGEDILFWRLIIEVELAEVLDWGGVAQEIGKIHCVDIQIMLKYSEAAALYDIFAWVFG